MADPFTIGLGVARAASSSFGGLKAQEEAEEAAEEQAQLTNIQRREEIRQMRRAAGQQRGAAVAGVYGSGLQMEGSAKRYVDALNVENMREIAFAETARRQELKAIEKGAQGIGRGMIYQGAGDLLGMAAGQLISSFGNRPPRPTLSRVGLNRAGHASVAPRLTMAAGMG